MATGWEAFHEAPAWLHRGFRWGHRVGCIWLHRWRISEFFFFSFWNVTAQQYLRLPAEDVCVNSKTWKPQTFSQFCFSGVKKNREREGEKKFVVSLTEYGLSLNSCYSWNSQHPLHSSAVCLSEMVGFLIGPSVPVTAHFSNFEVEIMCWAALLVDLLLIWSSSVISVVFKAELWHQPDFPVIVYISNTCSLCPKVHVHVLQGQMWLNVGHKRTCLSIFKGKGDAFFFVCIWTVQMNWLKWGSS